MSDRLRLNVSVLSDREIYSWAGETKFDDRGLFGLIDRGPLQTGGFASFLRLIFGNDEASFSYLGEEEVAGRRVLKYRFQTPEDRSHYAFGQDRIRVAYDGSFDADAGHAEPGPYRGPGLQSAGGQGHLRGYHDSRLPHDASAQRGLPVAGRH